jgi:hypothetical protein
MRYAIPALLLLAPAAVADDAVRVAARIDHHVAAKLTAANVDPAPPADDAEFFRRLCLDLTGRIPSLSLARDFLDDDRPDKRRLWADELLDGPDFADRYAAHFANHWRTVLLAQSNPQNIFPGQRIDDWLKKHLKANTPYDKVVRELLTSPEAAGYFSAYENKAENLAGSTSRTLLGVRLECAQCHADRGGGTWKREQFWQYAAFFSRLPGPRMEGNSFIQQTDNSTGVPRIRPSEKEEYVEAKFLDDVPLEWKAGTDPRAALAAWMTRPDNPWFARAAVNRVWHGLTGTGLVEPVDGLGAVDSPPSHPELLDELAREFVSHRFDLKFLIRSVIGSQAYQRTSRQTHPGQADPRLFARAVVRGLSAEQLFDSIAEATGYVPPPEPAGRVFGPAGPRARFLAKFPSAPDTPTDAQTSIQQALYLMNGQLSAEAVSPDRSKTLATIAAGSSVGDQVEQLFLVVLSRPPTAAERKRMIEYVEQKEERRQALADVFWALLNSTEFAVNH